MESFGILECVPKFRCSSTDFFHLHMIKQPYQCVLNVEKRWGNKFRANQSARLILNKLSNLTGMGHVGLAWVYHKICELSQFRSMNWVLCAGTRSRPGVLGEDQRVVRQRLRRAVTGYRTWSRAGRLSYPQRGFYILDLDKDRNQSGIRLKD